MALKDSKTGKIIRNYSIEELRDAANLMRGYDLVALCAAGSGHAGSTLSIMDIAAALYLHAADHDPKNPSWPDRDRIIWSAGHKAPSAVSRPGLRGLLSRSTTWSRCANSTRPFRVIRTGSSCRVLRFPRDRWARA